MLAGLTLYLWRSWRCGSPGESEKKGSFTRTGTILVPMAIQILIFGSFMDKNWTRCMLALGQRILKHQWAVFFVLFANPYLFLAFSLRASRDNACHRYRAKLDVPLRSCEQRWFSSDFSLLLSNILMALLIWLKSWSEKPFYSHRSRCP